MRSSLVMAAVLLALMPLACTPRIEAPDAVQPKVAVAQATAVVEPVVKVLPPTAPSVTATFAVAPTAVATKVAVEPTMMPAALPASASKRFKLQPAETVASFSLSEVLYGTPKIVVGTTSEVQGGLLVKQKVIKS